MSTLKNNSDDPFNEINSDSSSHVNSYNRNNDQQFDLNQEDIESRLVNSDLKNEPRTP